MNIYLHKLTKLMSASLPLLLCVSGEASAAQDNIAAPLAVGSGEVLGVAGGLVSVIAAILLAAFVYTKMKGPKLGGNNVINIIASQPLGPKERIVLVEIAGTQFAIGMTTSNVQTLHVFDKPVINAEELSDQPGFADKLKDALRGFGK